MSRRITESRFSDVLEDLARAYEAQDRSRKDGAETEVDVQKDPCRALEVKALKMGLKSETALEWVSTQLLDALRFLNGRPLASTPNLHFLADEALGEGAFEEKDIQVIARNLADREVRVACENQIRMHNVQVAQEIQGEK